MIFLGIDTSSGGIFMGTSTLAGERVQPRPSLTPILFVQQGGSPDWQSEMIIGEPKVLFLEQQYDLLSRLRRGCVYRWERSGNQWWVADPLRRDTGNAAAGQGYRFQMPLTTYQCDHLQDLRGRVLPKVYLGNNLHSTRWTIVAIEGAAGGGRF